MAMMVTTMTTTTAPIRLELYAAVERIPSLIKMKKKTYNSHMRISYPPGSVLEIEFISVPVFLLSLPPYNHTTIIQQTPADLIHRKIE